MPEWTSYPVFMTLGSLVFLLLSEYANFRPGVYLFKSIASIGFVISGAWYYRADKKYHYFIFWGLVYGLIGDILLLPQNSKTAFFMGLVTFLVGHTFYAIAFLTLGTDFNLLFFGGNFLAIFAFSAYYWLKSHVDGYMRFAILSYIMVISVMMATCFASLEFGPHKDERFFGALLFYLSDLGVARQMFVKKSFVNKFFGLSFYYVGQLLLAASCA